ncbi:MAG: nucleoside triphosphate pyrophosphohydrolase [Bacteroidetes bacterium RIFOXYA12_FULL_35_11]|nr:MAG: nucleoside triphosphate pyrophosphohydrolase [Bacteroidetes bacterium GWF2_35_48]OFY73328.1 MAG: nucleoside triphosphate pyrophosphohydrolase [Bacteroidetes bacterium RIFOXYA12_FULL_35_11]OFY95795.1 MAG: nucleoside triphosphate pyrophosphohydrolase [Bacteroidetes bacterium RIFOXYB2_FULL_35_7]OFZ02269.1 MAG: nucleoside triphosphate pyrophosphohydrolase [Bacteroidetes bacterium RIFOXYC12_FULL_35_7]HBX52273.1 nucleoside triphosphate pyrophosphohydrolase [Bacteroidales bacterium]
MHSKDEKLESIGKLLDIMDKLRESCPWDKKQTFETLRNLTIEETYELADAIIEKDIEGIRTELGDLLLHIVFYAKLGSETGSFDIKSVAEGINKKLIHRHPHIFGDVVVKDDEDVKKNWEALKLKEGKKMVLEGVPVSLPSMVKAKRIQEKVRGVGFDWDKREQVWDKVQEELQELKVEIENNDLDKIEAEFGDVFFSLINAARLYNIDPDNALERTNKKFISRFNYLEHETLHKGKSLHDMTLDEMNEIWEAAKKMDKNIE